MAYQVIKDCLEEIFRGGNATLAIDVLEYELYQLDLPDHIIERTLFHCRNAGTDPVNGGVIAAELVNQFEACDATGDYFSFVGAVARFTERRGHGPL